MEHKRRLIKSLTWVLGSFLVLSRFAWADPLLGKMQCLSLQATVLEVGESLGITPEVLRDAMRTALKAQLPDLKTDPACPNRLTYKVYLQNLSTETFHGFYGHTGLEARRKAMFQETGIPAEVRAWDLESYLHGTRDKAKLAVLDQLTSHLTQFATDYKAANK